MPKGAKTAVKPDKADMELSQLMGAFETLAKGMALLTEDMAAVKSDLAATKVSTPKIVPQIEMQQPQTPNLVGKQMAIGEMVGSSRQLTTDVQGNRVRVDRLPEGTKVKLLPESEVAQTVSRPGGKRKKVWNIETVGQIVGFHYYSDTRNECKYRVRFPGLTPARGDGFYESELVPV